MWMVRWIEGQWVVRVALALWLGLIVPLLCIPGISSNHTHGLHWVWEMGGSEPAPTPAPTATHAHSHGDDGHSHSHSHADAPPPDPTPADATPAPRVARALVPTLSTNINTAAEQLLNVFGVMQIPPLPLTLLVNAGWVLGILGLWLFRAAAPPLRPWQPPKAYA